MYNISIPMPNVFYLHEEGIEDTIINQIEYKKKKKKKKESE